MINRIYRKIILRIVIFPFALFIINHVYKTSKSFSETPFEEQNYINNDKNPNEGSEHIKLTDMNSLYLLLRFNSSLNDNNSPLSKEVKAFKKKSKSLEEKMYPKFKNCTKLKLIPKYIQRGDYWVLQNYIKASKSFRCNESITFSTTGELGLLNNLVQITSRWQGPVSVAVYAPGDSFEKTLETIFHLRECSSNDVKMLVTFHVFFDFQHIPEKVPKRHQLLKYKIDCSKIISDLDVRHPYRKKNGLSYPINLARNVAKSSTSTFFTFPCDIEQYPSVNIISDFLKMLQMPDIFNTWQKRVHVIPVFEVKENEVLPMTKSELLISLKEKKAFQFPKIPNYSKWVNSPITPGLSVITIIGKHKYDKQRWKKFYISTDEDPNLDERIFEEHEEEGQIIEDSILCLMDYEFHILDNAFVLLQSRIKETNKSENKCIYREGFSEVINNLKENYQVLLGNNKKCKFRL